LRSNLPELFRREVNSRQGESRHAIRSFGSPVVGIDVCPVPRAQVSYWKFGHETDPWYLTCPTSQGSAGKCGMGKANAFQVATLWLAS
jgi:hypothetical protein